MLFYSFVLFQKYFLESRFARENKLKRNCKTADFLLSNFFTVGNNNAKNKEAT